MPNSAGKGRNSLTQMDPCFKPRQQEELDGTGNAEDVLAPQPIRKPMGQDRRGDAWKNR